MKYRYILIILLCIALQSCTRKATREIVFWHALGGPPGDALESLVHEFNRTHPDIHIKSISMGSYQALSQKIMASIQTGTQPDISQVYESWTANLKKDNVILPLDGFIEADSLFKASLDDIYPVFIDNNTIDGQIWSFPFNKSVRVMYYNKDLFYRHGLDYDRPPKTWQEYRELCQLFTTGSGSEKKWGTTFNTDVWRFENLLLQAGGELMDADFGRPLFNSQAGVEALQFLTTLLNVDQTAYQSSGYDGQNNFLAQNVAFIEGSSASYAYMRDAEITFNMGVAAVPYFRTRRNFISGTNIAIFDKGDTVKSAASFEFIKWFTSAEQTARFSALTNYMPVRRSAFQQEAIQAMLIEHPSLADVYEQLEYAEFEPQIPAWFEFRKYLEEKVLESVFLQNISPQEALSVAEQRFLTDLN